LRFELGFGLGFGWLGLDLTSRIWDLLSGFSNIVSLTAIYSIKYAGYQKQKLGFVTKALDLDLDLWYKDSWCKLFAIW
jgi:hypothetical protein